MTNTVLSRSHSASWNGGVHINRSSTSVSGFDATRLPYCIKCTKHVSRCQLDQTGLPVQRRLDPASALPMGLEPDDPERDIRNALGFIDDQIAVLKDDSDTNEHALFWAVSEEVEAIDPGVRTRLLGWNGINDKDRDLIRNQRAPALERLQRERDELNAQLAALTQTDKPVFSAWTMMEEAHLHPEAFAWLLGQVRQRRCGAAGAPGRSIRKRALGRALQAAVSRHSARKAS